MRWCSKEKLEISKFRFDISKKNISFGEHLGLSNAPIALQYVILVVVLKVDQLLLNCNKIKEVLIFSKVFDENRISIQ